MYLYGKFPFHLLTLMASPKATSDRGFSSLVAAHEKICASFLGPKAENHKILHDKFIAIAEQVALARERFHPNDPVHIFNSSTEFR
jgi:hypothetical protein